MAHNPGRFVIIDGVQYSKERARRAGLIDDNDELTEKGRGDSSSPSAPVGKPSANRARSSSSTRRKASDPPVEDAPATEGDQES